MLTVKNGYSLLALCALAASVTACSVFSGHETSGEYVDDTTITSKVKTAMLEDPVVRPDVPQIHVETFRGIVQLSGFVDSRAIKDKADDLTGHVRGVKAIRNDMIIRSN